MKNGILYFFLLFGSSSSFAQERINDHNNINWLQSFNTINLDKKWQVHAEYQWRRADGFQQGQQSLFRTGIGYKINDQVSVQTGFAFVDTYRYGDYPIAANGTFPEWRIYEQVALRQPMKKLLLTQRLRIEQRWIGRVKPREGTGREIETWVFTYRFRYQARLQHPLWENKQKQIYAAAADELFINAGRNVGVNTFDQNRIFLLAGFKFSKKLSVEAGYFNQTLQQGRRVNDKIIMQRNNGMLLASYLTL